MSTTTEPRAELRVGSDVPDDFRALLSKGLGEHNDSVTGFSDRMALAVVVTDPATGDVVGGVSGRTSLGTLIIEQVWLHPAHRRGGLGHRMLAAAEEEGRRRGCKQGWLNTLSFQAPWFYERNGWERFGEVPCLPEGSSRIFFRKTL